MYILHTQQEEGSAVEVLSQIVVVTHINLFANF